MPLEVSEENRYERSDAYKNLERDTPEYEWLHPDNQKRSDHGNNNIHKEAQYVVWNNKQFAVFAREHRGTSLSNRTHRFLSGNPRTNQIHGFANADCGKRKKK